MVVWKWEADRRAPARAPGQRSSRLVSGAPKPAMLMSGRNRERRPLAGRSGSGRRWGDDRSGCSASVVRTSGAYEHGTAEAGESWQSDRDRSRSARRRLGRGLGSWA